VLDHPIIMGILNVTPDSFSDGGNFFSADAALDHAARMIDEGADIIDVGGEASGPGAEPVSVEEETHRILPIVRTIRERWESVAISVDTTKAAVARAALDAGADIINDVSAMRLDPAMPMLAGERGSGVILMHSRGDIAHMATYENAVYGDVISEVMSELSSQLLRADEAGVDRKAVVIDPGFGFSKRTEHSTKLLLNLREFCSLDVPVMVGVSRKRFVREASYSLAPGDSDAATSAINVMALERGASIFRVHNVRVNRHALDGAWTVLTAAQ
jgi:dihydropteroate synthase